MNNNSSTAGNDALAGMSLAAVAAKIRDGSVTSVQLTQACLTRIRIYSPKLDAFITVMTERALAQAAQLDAEASAGRFRGPLHGVPIALKDNIDTAGTRTTAASALFEDRVPTEDAPVTARLIAAGAVIIGKTNLHEFAMGAGEASFWGPTRNPWNLALNPGGSSSGSGAAVAADLCYGALGTDTAGSIRHPAAYCSTVGLKATFGLVPIRGIAPLTVCLDHCGPLTRTVEDTAIMLNTLAGYDRLDFTSVDHPKEDYVAALSQPVAGFKLGVPVGYDSWDPEIAAAVNEATDLLAGMTQGTQQVTLPSTNDFTIATLGYAGETYAWHKDYFHNAPGKYTLANRRRLQASSEAEGAAVDYIRAKWGLDLLRRSIDDAFGTADLLVLATMRQMPPVINEMLERIRNPKPANPRQFSNCAPFNAFGLPALSLPCGFSKSGLPISLMIVGKRFAEGKVLALGQAYEKATQWHTRKPPLTPQTVKPAVMEI